MIQRRQYLKRSTKPLKRTPLRRMSKKRRRESVIYSEKRKIFLQSHPWCEVAVGVATECVGGNRSTDVHHVAGRLGGNYLDESTWKASCRSCHDWIHNHPGQARQRGLLK